MEPNRTLIRLTFLGTGTSQGVPVIGCDCAVCCSADPRDARLRTSAMVEVANRRFVIDAGPDFREQMLLEDVSHITAILLTHKIESGIADLYLRSQVLDFAHNDVHEVPYWQNGGDLRIIDGSYNRIESVDTLWNMNSLTYAYMDYNELTSVGNLAKCPNLVMVNIYGNEIPQVDKLTERDIIVNWDPTN